jgi:hypothetical protein
MKGKILSYYPALRRDVRRKEKAAIGPFGYFFLSSLGEFRSEQRRTNRLLLDQFTDAESVKI